MTALLQPGAQPAAAHADLIEGQARVVAVDGAFVWLANLPPAACGSCATRSACGTPTAAGKALLPRHWRAPRTPLAGSAPLALGDTVRVGVDRGALTRAAWVAYGLPLLAMVAAALAAQGAGDAAAAGAALAGLLLGAAVSRRLVRRWQDALLPVVLGRVGPEACALATVPLAQLQRPPRRP